MRRAPARDGVGKPRGSPVCSGRVCLPSRRPGRDAGGGLGTEGRTWGINRGWVGRVGRAGAAGVAAGDDVGKSLRASRGLRRVARWSGWRCAAAWLGSGARLALGRGAGAAGAGAAGALTWHFSCSVVHGPPGSRPAPPRRRDAAPWLGTELGAARRTAQRTGMNLNLVVLPGRPRPRGKAKRNAHCKFHNQTRSVRGMQ